MIKAANLQVNPENAKIGSSAEPIRVCLTMTEGTNVDLTWNSGEPGAADTIKRRDSAYCFSMFHFFEIYVIMFENIVNIRMIIIIIIFGYTFITL